MAARMQLVKKGMDFSFSVFFDRITEKQLRKLVFALDLGENSDDSRRCHKLGHGKPVGLGSVKIIVDQIITRSFVENHYSLNDITKNILSSLKLLCSLLFWISYLIWIMLQGMMWIIRA